MQRAKDVDEYIALAPEEVRGKLVALRQLIKQTTPEAEERISYGMPYYGYHGRLVYFAYFKHHIGLYIPPPIIEDHLKELVKFKIAKSTVKFPLTQDLPLPLIRKLVLARKAFNLANRK